MEPLLWRKRIGLITTSGQVVTEPRYYQLAPPGVTFHTLTHAPTPAGRTDSSAWSRTPRAPSRNSRPPTSTPIAVAENLEQIIRKPVVTSHTATLWRALALAGIHDPIEGAGALLADTR